MARYARLCQEAEIFSHKTRQATTSLWLGMLLFGAMCETVPAGARLDRLNSFGLPELSGTEPLTPVLDGSDGVLYGTTSKGGPSSAPTIYKVNRDGNGYRVLLWLPGATAVSALTEDATGWLYGTVRSTIGTNGPTTGSGTVFRLAKDGSGFTALHTFYSTSSATEGISPRSPLLLSAGLLYGTASSGGQSNNGTIFRLSVDGSNFTVLHHFLGTAAGDGANPQAKLLLASDGFLYGTTYSGGTGSYGTVFRINRDGSNYEVVRNFSYGTTDPVRPNSELVEGPDGALYGAANSVFRLTKDGSNLSTLVSGIWPSGLVFGTDQRLYGTSALSGITNQGMVFSMRADGSDLRVLHSFLDPNGTSPAPPALGRDGFLYGTDRYGGAAQVGEVFRLNTNGTGFLILHDCSLSGGDGRYPGVELIRGSDGDFYGTTTAGGIYERGTVFRARRDGTTTVLYHFGTSTADGSSPSGALLEASDGALYGTTAYGAADDPYASGTIFKINKDGSGYAILYNFLGSPASQWHPAAPLLEGQDGLLYSTTLYGGSANCGTVFSLAKDGSSFTVLHEFLGSSRADGQEPRGRLIQSADGALYGCTYRGSTTQRSPSDFGYGTVFTLATNGSAYAVLYSFDYFNGDASRPLQVIEGRDGALYGITDSLIVAGGTSNTNIDGTVFTLTKDGGSYQILHAFGSVTNDGIGPSGLIEDVDGTLYGTTTTGGTNRLGTVFRIHKDQSGYQSLVSLANPGPSGILSAIGLARGSDSTFYGVTFRGGTMDYGTLFRFLPPEFPDLRGVTAGPNPIITFAGVSGLTYELLRSTDLANWVSVKVVQMPVDGLYLHQDLAAPASGAFYRVRWLR